VLRGHLSWAHVHANKFRQLHWHGLRVGERYAYFWGLALDPAGRRQARVKDVFFNRDRCSAFTLNAETARAFFHRMVRCPVRYAYGYPSALAQFADELTDQGLDGHRLGWKAVITTAEALHPQQRERIGAAFGCGVADDYGCAEAGDAGLECEHGGLHIPVESVVVDLLPTAEGQLELLITDLHNFSQPMIRYRVGDLVDPAPVDPCPCGRPLPLLGRVYGRAGDVLTLPDGRRVNANLPSYIFKHHGVAGTVREYQFVQYPDGRIELRITAGPAWTSGVEPGLRTEVRAALGVDVDVRLVPRFERRGRGKHRDFVRAEDLGE
jgi:phenylacetate-CoA ligase